MELINVNTEDVLLMGISKLIKNEVKLIKGNLPAGKVDAIMRLYMNYVDDLNTNGWQCDYSYTMKLENRVFSVIGCAWYGNFEIEELL